MSSKEPYFSLPQLITHLDDIGQPGSTNKGNKVVLARQFRALCYSTSKSGVSLCRSGLLFAKPMLTLQDFEYATS